MSTAKTMMRIGLAIFMAGAGILHFVNPRPYVQHLPEVVPFRAELVAITGVMEFVLAAGLVGPRGLRRPTGIALAVFLVLVLPANVYAAVSQVPIDGIPTGWLHWARLPFPAHRGRALVHASGLTTADVTRAQRGSSGHLTTAREGTSASACALAP